MKHHGQDVEKFPGDDHRQVYWAWRHYPRAMRHTMTVGSFLGFAAGLLTSLLFK